MKKLSSPPHSSFSSSPHSFSSSPRRRGSIPVFFFLLFLILLPTFAFAQEPQNCDFTGWTFIPCSPTASIGPAGRLSATGFIMSVINILLMVTGLLSALFLIIGGIRYVTAHGNEEMAEAAKKTITHAVIGMVVVILSFVIVRVISNALIFGSLGT